MRASAVYASTTLIAQTISSLPVRILERNDTERLPQRPLEARVLWDTPNGVQTVTSLIETVVLSQLLYGNAYLYIRRDNAGRIVELWPIDPDRVVDLEPVEDAAGRIGVRFTIEDLGVLENLPGKPHQIVHIPFTTLPGRLRGLSPIEQVAELVGMSLSTQEHASRFLGSGVHLAGIIETPGAIDGGKAKALQESFNLINSGPRASGRVGVLSGGASFRQLTMSPVELQFLEQMRYSDQKIASIFRVPPHMVGDVAGSTSWGSGIEEQTTQFVAHTLTPILRRIEEALELTVLAGTSYEVRFVLSGLLRGNVAVRSAFYSSLWNIGALSADDIRRLEDMPPVPNGGGEGYYVPLNTAPASASAEELAQRSALITEALRGGRA